MLVTSIRGVYEVIYVIYVKSIFNNFLYLNINNFLNKKTNCLQILYAIQTYFDKKKQISRILQIYPLEFFPRIVFLLYFTAYLCPLL